MTTSKFFIFLGLVLMCFSCGKGADEERLMGEIGQGNRNKEHVPSTLRWNAYESVRGHYLFVDGNRVLTHSRVQSRPAGRLVQPNKCDGVGDRMGFGYCGHCCNEVKPECVH